MRRFPGKITAFSSGWVSKRMASEKRRLLGTDFFSIAGGALQGLQGRLGGTPASSAVMAPPIVAACPGHTRREGIQTGSGLGAGAHNEVVIGSCTMRLLVRRSFGCSQATRQPASEREP